MAFGRETGRSLGPRRGSSISAGMIAAFLVGLAIIGLITYAVFSNGMINGSGTGWDGAEGGIPNQSITQEGNLENSAFRGNNPESGAPGAPGGTEGTR